MKKTQKIFVDPIMTEEQSDAMAGVFLKETDCHKLITFDADIFDKATKKCLAKFRKKVVPGEIQQIAYDSLLIAAASTDNRGTAGGTIKNPYSKKTVNSGIIGYFDRYPRIPFCRLTAFNQKHFDKFKDAYPIIKLVDNYYAELMPKEYKRQRDEADKTSQDFVIKGTAFTTITVNKNWQTAVHKDAGDFMGGFGNLVAMRKGNYIGCHLVLVRWGVGFDLQNGDLLLMDVHQWHGNTPMIKQDAKATRLSLVMYYRADMIKCGSMKDELKIAQNRKRNQKMY